MPPGIGSWLFAHPCPPSSTPPHPSPGHVRSLRVAMGKARPGSHRAPGEGARWPGGGPRAGRPRCRRNVGSTDGPLSIKQREAFLFACVGSAQITLRGPELQAGRGRNSLQMKGCQKIVFSQLRVCVRKGRREEGAAEAVAVTDFLTS